METDTLALSRRIVAAVDPDGTRWPEWWKVEMYGEAMSEPICIAPDLSMPQNLHHSYAVADAADLTHNGHPAEVAWIEDHFEVPHWIPSDEDYGWGTGATRNLALMDAVAQAKGVE